MKYVIMKQFLPGNDRIWVEKLDANDPAYAYDTVEEAILKLKELQSADPIRGFKIAEKD